MSFLPFILSDLVLPAFHIFLSFFEPPPGGGLVLVTIQGRVPFRRRHIFFLRDYFQLPAGQKKTNEQTTRQRSRTNIQNQNKM